ncbi:ABC transporter permease [Phreatobacter sp.]|uniref:ABC transporter permease n=1 Tax=Phreatobacter sp. TaxID=1966341 RepID=UPI003F722DCF
MRAFLAGRLIAAGIALWAVATLTFVLINLAPGGPAVALAGDYGAPGQIEEITRAYGLDRPLGLRYLDHMVRLATGDLGQSYRSQAPVRTLIAESLPVSLALLVPAILLSALIGIGLGLGTASLGRGGAGLFTGLMAAAHAVPVYVVAQGLVLGLAVWLGLLPVQGLLDPRQSPTGIAAVADMARHLILPVTALALHHVTFMALMTRTRLALELARPYAVTARAKGLSLGRTRRNHALPNALLPIVTLSGQRLGGILGGVVIVETVFALPGLGRLAVAATIARDHPLVIGTVLAACAIVILGNLIADILVAWLDPRTAGDLSS